MLTDPSHTLLASPMTARQVAVVGVTVALNALDGFDVLSISFASPGIANEWRIDRAALGVVLSMELIGMAIGSFVLGGVADRIGRRPTIIGCLVLMTIGMFMATTVTGLVDLSAWRIVTGLGIGGVLAATNAVAAEFSNTRRRHLCVSIMAIGYPIGAVVGGVIAAQLLAMASWRSVFYFGAGVTAALVPVVLLLVPESVPWLARKQPPGALDTINRTLRWLGHEVVSALPAVASQAGRRAHTDIFSPALFRTTVLVTLAYFSHITTFYFMLKWVPKMVVDMGFAASSAAGVLVWANVGGATGGALLGLASQRAGIRGLTITAMLLSTVAVTAFGRTPPDLGALSLMCAVAGFATNAAIVGMYAILAQAFPTDARASGTGTAIGVGRGGAVLAPIVAGVLFQQGAGLPAVALTMSAGSLVAACALALVRLERGGAAEQ
jgi:MFS transporter, AAHS family, vanillate permease